MDEKRPRNFLQVLAWQSPPTPTTNERVPGAGGTDAAPSSARDQGGAWKFTWGWAFTVWMGTLDQPGVAEGKSKGVQEGKGCKRGKAQGDGQAGPFGSEQKVE